MAETPLFCASNMAALARVIEREIAIIVMLLDLADLILTLQTSSVKGYKDLGGKERREIQ